MNHGFILIELLTALVIVSYCLGAGLNYLYTSQQHSRLLYDQYVKHLERVSAHEIRLHHLRPQGRNAP
jgi:type II secretory pathway component PulJ